MEIREAAQDDASPVNALLTQLGYPQDDVAVTAARIRAWTVDPTSAAYVAVDGDELLGVIAVHVCPPSNVTAAGAGSWP